MSVGPSSGADQTPARPIVWCVAGTDSGGGAGLTADQRAADAFGVHGCPIVAAVTAQNSRGVTHVDVMPVSVLEAQFDALRIDMRPQAVKTGLLGSAANVRAVARLIDRLRLDGPVALVVDPVLGATTGRGFADEETLVAYRRELLPRATLVTPNRREAVALLSVAGRGDEGAEAPAESTPGASTDPATPSGIPRLARRLHSLGAQAVCITGGDGSEADGEALDWLLSAYASGWLASPRVDTPHHHGTGCTFATSAAAAMALGFVTADAVVLAKMATSHSLRRAYAAGNGAGPVFASTGFESTADLLPSMSFGESRPLRRTTAPTTPTTARTTPRRVADDWPLGLYAIVDSAERVRQALRAGITTLQLRIKTPLEPDDDWHLTLRREISDSVVACRAAAREDIELFINDHWRLAIECGAEGVHLGQEDLLALSESEREALAASGLALGVSSHSLWELCRARSLPLRYVACGPVWPTLTKAMPWRPQGLHNLRWWSAMAGDPVVAIGGILEPAQVKAAAARGASGVCVVRALGDDMSCTVPALRAALDAGTRAFSAARGPSLPRPSLPQPALLR